MNDLFQQADQTFDENKNYLQELVGEGKKFKTNEELAKGKAYADQMIELKNKREDDMRAEITRLREENIAKAKLEELLTQLKTERLASSEPPIANEDHPKPFNADDIKKLVADQVKAEKQQDKQSENADLVRNKLKEQWGSNYTNILKEKTEELGLTEEYVNNLAKNAPKALFKALELDRSKADDIFTSPPRSAQRNDNFAPTGVKERTWAYYQEMKKADPQLYSDKRTAIQMQQDAIRLGDKFRDGNYFVKGLHEQ